MWKRAATAVGIVAGIAAIVWAMRDRFISVSTAREPKPPAFRSMRPITGPDLETIDGIGPTYAKRLADAGIGDVASLGRSSPDLVAESAGVSTARARAWIEQASGRS